MSIRVEEQELSIMDDMLKALRALGDYQSRRRVMTYVNCRIEADETDVWMKQHAEMREKKEPGAVRPDFDSFSPVGQKERDPIALLSK